MSGKIVYLLLFIIIAVGAYLRLEGILTNSFAFTYDVGRDMLAVRDIVVNHKLTLIGPTTGLGGLFYGPWWYYILAIPFVFANGNPQGVAFFMGLCGVATILLGFILGKKLGGNKLGIIFAFTIASSAVMVGISSQIWNPNLIPFFLIVFLVIVRELLESMQRAKGLYLLHYFSMGFVLSLLIDLEVIFGLLFAFASIVSLLLFIRKNIRIKSVGAFIFGFLLVLFPRLFFEVRHSFIMTKTILSQMNHDSPLGAFSFLKNITASLNDLKNLWNATIAGKNDLIGIILLIFTISTITIFYKRVSLVQKAFLIYFSITLGVFVFGFAFFSDAIWAHYLIGIPIIYITIFALATTAVLSYVPKSLPFILVLLFLIFALHIRELKVVDAWGKPMFEGNAAVYRNQLAVIDYIYQNAKGEKFNYIVYTPPVHDYTYKYLFLWYGPKKYHYIPSGEKASLFYLILEPDFENPNRLKDWFVIREEDGKILKDEEVRGGIRVQSRLH